MLVEGGGNADDDGVHFFEPGEVVGGLKALLFDFLGNAGSRDMMNVTLSPPELFNLAGVDVKPRRLEPCLGAQKRKGQPHITQSDHAHSSRSILKLRRQRQTLALPE